jgi:MFS family permease
MNREQIKFVITSVSGNILEWYDFALYGYFATVIAKLFFPVKDEFVSLMITFGVFASGFIARPLGGIIFGHIGDRYGRRVALVASIALIMIPTAGIGILPTYSSIGIAAPIALTCFRLLQGIAVSGELTGSGIFLIECAAKKNRGFYGSLIMCSTYLGLLLGAAISALIAWIFSADQVENFAWRIPFIISFFFGLGALFLRLKCEESPVFKEILQSDQVVKLPIYDAVKSFFVPIVYICLVSSALAVAIYLLIGYFPSYFVSNKYMTLNQSMVTSFLGLLVLTVCVPIMGKLADVVGHKNILGIGAIGFILFAYLIFYLAANGSFFSSIMSVVLVAIILSPIAASLIFIITNIFPANIRYSGASLGYNISMTIFGGTTPLIAMYMVKHTGSELSPSFYLAVCGLLTLCSLILIKINNKKNAKQGFYSI